MSTLSSTVIHVHKVEKFNWRTVRYFMFTKYKSVTGDIYDTLCSQSGKFYVEKSIIFSFHEVEKLYWGTVRYFMSTKWKRLNGELCDI